MDQRGEIPGELHLTPKRRVLATHRGEGVAETSPVRLQGFAAWTKYFREKGLDALDVDKSTGLIDYRRALNETRLNPYTGASLVGISGKHASNTQVRFYDIPGVTTPDQPEGYALIKEHPDDPFGLPQFGDPGISLRALRNGVIVEGITSSEPEPVTTILMEEVDVKKMPPQHFPRL